MHPRWPHISSVSCATVSDMVWVAFDDIQPLCVRFKIRPGIYTTAPASDAALERSFERVGGASNRHCARRRRRANPCQDFARLHTFRRIRAERLQLLSAPRNAHTFRSAGPAPCPRRMSHPASPNSSTTTLPHSAKVPPRLALLIRAHPTSHAARRPQSRAFIRDRAVRNCDQ